MSQSTSQIPGVHGLATNELAHSAPEIGGDVAKLPTGPAAFTGVTREAVYRQALERRGEGAWKIRQGGASLCGPACFMYILAKHHGAEYFQFVTTLFEKGDATLGKLRVRPGKDCLAYDPKGSIGAADWVSLGGLRDSENAIFNYSESSDEFAGITFPWGLAGWFTRAGYTEVVNQANIYFTSSEANFREAMSLHAQGWEVCFLIKMEVVEENIKRRGGLSQVFTTPTHWVVLRSVAGPVLDSLILDVYTWGEQKHRVPYNTTDPLSMSTWLQNYYGFVACKP